MSTLVIEILVFAGAVAAMATGTLPPSTNGGDQSSEDTTKIEALIKKKVQGAEMYTLFSAVGLAATIFGFARIIGTIFGFAAIIACPLAFLYAGQALRLIDEHGVGERYRHTAKNVRKFAAIIFVFCAVVALVFILIAVLVGM